MNGKTQHPVNGTIRHSVNGTIQHSVRPEPVEGAAEGFLFVKRTSETVDYRGFVKFLHCLFAALRASVQDKPRNDSKKGPLSLFNKLN